MAVKPKSKKAPAKRKPATSKVKAKQEISPREERLNTRFLKQSDRIMIACDSARDTFDEAAGIMDQVGAELQKAGDSIEAFEYEKAETHLNKAKQLTSTIGF
jgi:hypothetical protein